MLLKTTASRKITWSTTRAIRRKWLSASRGSLKNKFLKAAELYTSFAKTAT